MNASPLQAQLDQAFAVALRNYTTLDTDLNYYAADEGVRNSYLATINRAARTIDQLAQLILQADTYNALNAEAPILVTDAYRKTPSLFLHFCDTHRVVRELTRQAPADIQSCLLRLKESAWSKREPPPPPKRRRLN